MQSNLLLDDLTEAVLQEIGKFGLGSATNCHYRLAYKTFNAFAAARKTAADLPCSQSKRDVRRFSDVECASPVRSTHGIDSYRTLR